jgi:hypothetical protein
MRHRASTVPLTTWPPPGPLSTKPVGALAGLACQPPKASRWSPLASLMRWSSLNTAARPSALIGLAAKDATIAQQRYEITDLRRRLAESEADAYRLRVGPWGTTERKVTPRPARCRSVRSCRLVAPPPSPRPKPLSSQFTVSEP